MNRKLGGENTPRSASSILKTDNNIYSDSSNQIDPSKKFVSYEVACALRSLGFNGKSSGYYHSGMDSDVFLVEGPYQFNEDNINIKFRGGITGKDFVSAPTFNEVKIWYESVCSFMQDIGVKLD